MSFIENAGAPWAALQRLQASPDWKLTNANAWVPALFREAFTRPPSSPGRLPNHDGLLPAPAPLGRRTPARGLDRVENLVQESNQGPAARIAFLREEPARREEMIRALETGLPPPPRCHTALEAARDILNLAAALLAGFKRMCDGLERCCTTCAGKRCGIQRR